MYATEAQARILSTDPDAGKVLVRFNRCPVHGAASISIEPLHGRHGTRVTPGKCCGRWDSIRAWKVRAEDITSAVESALRGNANESK